MSYARSRLTIIETVLPYGNPTGLLHLRFVDDYKTFCGRECDGWSKSDQPFHTVMDSAYCCKRCKTAALK
jgi:hypothetical protein